MGRANLQPLDTKIRRGTEGGGVVWDIPAKGKIGFFLIFGVLWTLTTAVVSGGFLLTFLSGGKTEGNLPNWWLIPFFGVFWVTGLILLYLGVRETCMKHRLSVSAGELILQREMLGRRSEKRMLVSEIRSVVQAVFYQQNYQPVFGIEIKGARGKLRFGSGLGDPDKAWLVADLRETIFGSDPARASVSDARPLPLPPRNANFSVEIPNAREQMWPIAIIMGLVGIGFLVFVTKFFHDAPSSAGKNAPLSIWIFDSIFYLAEHGFQLVATLAGGAMVITSIILLIHLLRSPNSVRKLEGNSVEIAIRSYRHSLVWKEQTFPRTNVTDVRASQSGSSGEKIMKRLELIVGNQVVKLASWVDGEKADAVVREVRAVL